MVRALSQRSTCTITVSTSWTVLCPKALPSHCCSSSRWDLSIRKESGSVTKVSTRTHTRRRDVRGNWISLSISKHEFLRGGYNALHDRDCRCSHLRLCFTRVVAPFP